MFQYYWVYFQPTQEFCHALSFFFVIFNNILVIPVNREKIKIKLALAIPTGAPTILVNEQIDTPPVVGLKTVKILPM